MTQNANQRVQKLLETIEEARKSLQASNDQRASALMSLDSFAYDLKLVEDEKQSILEEYHASKEYFDRERNQMIAQADFIQSQSKTREQELISKNDELNEQNQEYQFQIEKLKVELADTRSELQTANKNVESRTEEWKRARATLQSMEAKIAEALERERQAKIREDEIENFLKRIKGHSENSNAKQNAESAIYRTEQNHAIHDVKDAIDARNARIESGRPDSGRSENLEDYLKRLGY
jgi:chromosome segregation ATPase